MEILLFTWALVFADPNNYRFELVNQFYSRDECEVFRKKNFEDNDNFMCVSISHD